MSHRSEKAISVQTPQLKQALDRANLKLGSAIFFRITKTQSPRDDRGRLEAFVENISGEFEFFKAWDLIWDTRTSLIAHMAVLAIS